MTKIAWITVNDYNPDKHLLLEIGYYSNSDNPNGWVKIQYTVKDPEDTGEDTDGLK